MVKKAPEEMAAIFANQEEMLESLAREKHKPYPFE
jgi:hypothetical protein